MKREEIKKLTPVKAIQLYFSKENQKVSLAEFKDLTPEDRKELGELAKEIVWTPLGD